MTKNDALIVYVKNVIFSFLKKQREGIQNGSEESVNDSLCSTQRMEFHRKSSMELSFNFDARQKASQQILFSIAQPESSDGRFNI